MLPEPQLRLDIGSGQLHDERGQVFDPATRRWSEAQPVATGEPVSAVRALRWLQSESGMPLRTPVGVIGTRTPTPSQAVAAEAMGALLPEHGVTVLCGGAVGRDGSGLPRRRPHRRALDRPPTR